MAKTIAVSDEVYNLLKNEKLPNESFSKVIKRSVKRRGRLSDIIGTKTLTKVDWEAAKKEIKKSEDLAAAKLKKWYLK